jgi:hypothetical protein
MAGIYTVFQGRGQIMVNTLNTSPERKGETMNLRYIPREIV